MRLGVKKAADELPQWMRTKEHPRGLCRFSSQ